MAPQKTGHSWQCSQRICKNLEVNAADTPINAFTQVINKNKLQIDINSRKVDCLIDTGAQISCISRYILQQVAPTADIHPAELKAVVGVCGERHPVLGATTLIFSCDGYSFFTKLLCF